MDLRTARRAAGITQTELARAAGVPQPNLSAYENGRRTASPDVLARITAALRARPSGRIERHRDDIRRLVTVHQAHSPRLFGSIARGEDHPGSDVGLVVDFAGGASRLLDQAALQQDLEDHLGVTVDVVASGSLQGRFGARVRGEAVPL